MSEAVDSQTNKVDEAFDALVEAVMLYTETVATELAAGFTKSPYEGLLVTLRDNISQDATRLHKASTLLADLKALA